MNKIKDYFRNLIKIDKISKNDYLEFLFSETETMNNVKLANIYNPESDFIYNIQYKPQEINEKNQLNFFANLKVKFVII